MARKLRDGIDTGSDAGGASRRRHLPCSFGERLGTGEAKQGDAFFEPRVGQNISRIQCVLLKQFDYIVHRLSQPARIDGYALSRPLNLTFVSGARGPATEVHEQSHLANPCFPEACGTQPTPLNLELYNPLPTANGSDATVPRNAFPSPETKELRT